MKRCSWCLLLGKERVYDIRKLREHFDTDIMTGYLLGGVLESWLSDAGETGILKRVEGIDRSGDIGVQLEYIFGVRPEKKTKPKLPPHISTKPAAKREAAAPAVTAALPSSFSSSFSVSSFSVTSFRTSSFSSSLSVGSLNISSLSAKLLSFQMLSGSFFSGSLTLSSLHMGAFGRGLGYSTGSYNIGSLRFGSGLGFGYGYGQGSGSFRSGSGGSFSRIYSGSFSGSFRYYAGNTEITAEEYHRTLINLSSCPLNEYGYGIHLV